MTIGKSLPPATADLAATHNPADAGPSQQRRRTHGALAAVGPLSQLPSGLLRQVVLGAIDVVRPKVATRQLASLRQVNRDFRDAVAQVQREQPGVQRLISERQMGHAIKEIVREWPHAHPSVGYIPERLAAAVRVQDQVIVDLDLFREAGPVLAQMFLDALSGHPNLRALDVTAREGLLLNGMTKLLDTRPELLRSLDVATKRDSPLLGDDICASPGLLSKVLGKQTNLTALKLHDALNAQHGHRRLSLDHAGLDQAIASLSGGLKSLNLSGYYFPQRDGLNDGTTLANVLRSLPALEDLELRNNRLDAAAFAQFASSLPALSALRRLDLGRTALRGPLDVNGESFGHLARALHALGKLETLDMSCTELNTRDFEQLAGGLASLKHLRALNLADNHLGSEGQSRLCAVAADLPALQYLRFNPSRPEPLDKLVTALGPLAERRGLQVHLTRMVEDELPPLRAALPNLHLSA